MADKRLYSSAGDGYFESFDYGGSWNRPMEGLRHHYLFGLAIDSGDPNIVIVSASLGLGGLTLLTMRSRLFIEEMRIVKNGRSFQMVSPYQVGQQSRCLPQIQKLRENSMLLTTTVYLSRLILVFHGVNLTFNGQKSIPDKLLGLSQLGPDLLSNYCKTVS